MSPGWRNTDLLWKAANGTGEEEVLISNDSIAVPDAWSPDGSTILVMEPGIGVGGDDVSTLDLTDRTIETLIDTPFDNMRPALSLDGCWLAYQSGETGRFLMLKATGDDTAGVTEIQIVLNWLEELKARVPTGR